MKKSLIIASMFAATVFTASAFAAEEQTAPEVDNVVAGEQAVPFEGVAASSSAPTIENVDASFQTMDANQDGVISIEEAETNDMLINAFVELDLDKTADLSKEEFSKFAALAK